MKQHDDASLEELIASHPDMPVPVDRVPATAIAPPSTLFPTVPIGDLTRARTYQDRFEQNISMYCWEWRPELGYYWERHATWDGAIALHGAALSRIADTSLLTETMSASLESAVQP